MTKIQFLSIPGATSNEEIRTLSSDYNLLAKELGSTTIEISKGSVEWLRQGKSIAETKELLKSTMMLSKLGALESAEATDYLTAVLNSYKLEAKDAERVVDRLISVDNVAATSAGKQFARIYGNI
jgi:TP901 family phage tail tape measure protein